MTKKQDNHKSSSFYGEKMSAPSTLSSLRKRKRDEQNTNSTVTQPVPEGVNDYKQETNLSASEFYRLYNSLKTKKAVIFRGSPGSGKSFIARKLAKSLVLDDTLFDTNIVTVQFHPSYRYEDFMVGLKPNINEAVGHQAVVSIATGRTSIKPAEKALGFNLSTHNDDVYYKNLAKSATYYKVAPGEFVKFAKKAVDNSGQQFVMIIDEINRGKVTEIFGEAMTLMEESLRGNPAKGMPLQHSVKGCFDGGNAFDEKFYIPSNLYIIGTMNTADVDTSAYGGRDDPMSIAFMRRFRQFDFLNPNFLSANFNEENAIKMPRVINTETMIFNFKEKQKVVVDGLTNIVNDTVEPNTNDNTDNTTDNDNMNVDGDDVTSTTYNDIFLDKDDAQMRDILKQEIDLFFNEFKCVWKKAHTILKPTGISNSGGSKWSFGFIGPSVYLDCWTGWGSHEGEGNLTVSAIAENLIKIHLSVENNWNETVVPILLKLYPFVKIARGRGSVTQSSNMFDWEELSKTE